MSLIVNSAYQMW